MVMFLIPLVIVALLMLPLIPVYRGVTTGKKAKRNVIFNLCAFFGVAGLALFFPVGGLVSAAGVIDGTASGLGFLAAALSTGLSSLGAGIAVAAAAPAAIGAFSENPKAFGKSIIFVALGEGVALYGMLISFMILGKI